MALLRTYCDWFLMLEAGLCLLCITPSPEITERTVSSLGEKNCRLSELLQDGICYLLLSPAEAPSLLLSSDTGQTVQVSDE